MTTEHKEQSPPEVPILLAPLSEEAKEAVKALEGEGWVIVHLTGDSIKDTIKKSNTKLRYGVGWPSDRQAFESLLSLEGEAIINRMTPLLLESGDEARSAQDKMIANLPFGKSVPGIKGVMGRAADYIALICAVREMGIDPLTVQGIPYVDIRTYTPHNFDESVTVGSRRNDHDLIVESWRPTDPYKSIYALSMFVSAESKLPWLEAKKAA